ncbi:hypothetical protein SAMN00790413_04241 [Deinococcus hopiensis KR-140]|uniref:Uncharacterized protein n=1 Tax=Deinococcus hopiensis KR-140 TaxID=695939 RepID=A0A1W1UPX4_9DEIO|nr:hypothetical protein SAMN00790413_04241 [Deinococcus hopiensis KR-140]
MVHVPMVHVPEEQASALQYAGHLQPVRWGLGRPKGERVHLPNMDARGDGAGRRMGLGPSPAFAGEVAFGSPLFLWSMGKC